MNEHPIIFSGEMVLAILEGRKKMTRRICKLPEGARNIQYWSPPSGRSTPGYANPGVNYWTERGNHIDPCPYGQRGDRLFVRETFAQIYIDDGCIHDEEPGPCPEKCSGCRIEYKADTGDKYPGGWDDEDVQDAPRWRSPYHMFRWQSRITLEVKSIRVERLQDITLEDIAAEGWPDAPKEKEVWAAELFELAQAGFGWFVPLWDSINAKRGFPWSSNSWVWVIDFGTEVNPPKEKIA